MKKGFITIAVGIGLVSAMIGAVLIYNYIPIGWFKYLDFSQPLIGTTITDISTATRFADFPAIYNANNLALNNGKIEVSTTTLPLITTLSGLTTVGTITSGTWNGTAISVAYNGTGTTSPTDKQVIIGNGASGFQVIGFGSSGQFLTSAGANALPFWTTSAIDTTLNYTWTGLHSFAATTTMATTTITSLSVNGISVVPKFGGDGSDGALSITSGTTNIDVGGVAVYIKNYTSISITGTGNLTFSNPHANGTIIILKSQGNITLTSSAAPMIDVSGMGAIYGAGGATDGGSGTNGTAGIRTLDALTHYGALGTGGAGYGTGTGGSGGTAGVQLTLNSGSSYMYSDSSDDVNLSHLIWFPTTPGAGGGGGGGGTDGSAPGAAGGRGGGILIIECAGYWNFTTANGISVAGKTGSSGTSPGGAIATGGGGGGGGGAGGAVLVLYNFLTSNTGTINKTGGNGGTGGNGSNGTDTNPQAGGGGGGAGSGAGFYSAAGGNGGGGGAGGASNNPGSAGSAGANSTTATGGAGGTGGAAGGAGRGGGGGGGGGGAGANGWSVVMVNKVF